MDLHKIVEVGEVNFQVKMLKNKKKHWFSNTNALTPDLRV